MVRVYVVVVVKEVKWVIVMGCGWPLKQKKIDFMTTEFRWNKLMVVAGT